MHNDLWTIATIGEIYWDALTLLHNPTLTWDVDRMPILREE